MKKIFAVLLCVCLLLPTFGLSAVQSVAAAEGGYVLAPIGYRANVSTTSHFSVASSFDKIDLTQYGYPADGSAIQQGKLAIQFDTYITGENNNSAVGSSLDGQVELTSSGTCDVEEMYAGANNIKFKWREWNRFTIDLATFTAFTGGGAFNPKNFYYLRIYFTAKAGNGSVYNVKVANVKLVDLTKAGQAPSLEEDPMGDGSFVPEAPVWRVMDTPEGYNNGETIVAGYNLVEYVESHKNVPEIQQCLKNDDYAPIIQSLVDGLYTAGGGAMYIPSGVYPCRTEVIMKPGTVIYGDWKNPEENPEISGTVLAVYAGKNSANSLPFISLGAHSMVKHLNFWYPEQGYEKDTVIPYSATVGLAGFAWAEKCTFVNSYLAIKNGPNYCNGPNAQDIYGTPLYLGLEFSFAIDYGRMENLRFSPKYWENSGLEGAPTSEADKSAFENFLYWNATGVACGRIDWSLLTYIYVDGYSAGVVFADHAAGPPNGQNSNIHIKNCKVGLSIVGTHICGEMIANSSFINCEYGVWIPDASVNKAEDSIVMLINCEIDATEYAVYQQRGTMLQVLSCNIKGGVVGATYGWYTMVNTIFETEAPHVVLENGTISAVLVGCTTASGGAVVIENQGFCPVVNDPKKADVAPVVTFTDEEGRDQERSVKVNNFYLVTDLANDGKTDVTAALQEKLNTAKEAGGGVVHLISGNYRVNGTVIIPTGVELRGALDLGNHATGGLGTYFSITRTTNLDEPTFVMEAGSGMRGLGFDYPDQGFDDNFERGRFTEYPYAVQGRGADIYLINVQMHNVWNGLDMMTYRCDNHYIDYLGGQCYNNFISVGGGSENGIIRNYHVNPNADRSVYTAGKKNADSFETVRYRQTQNNAVVIKVGHVGNQFIYNGVNYSCYIGIQVVPEESGKATLRAVGNAMDYCTLPVQVLDAEKADFLNLQMCAFNQLGSALKKDVHHIHLGPDNTATVNSVGMIFWETSDSYVKVENGTLNLYGFHDNSWSSMFAIPSKNGKVNAVAPYFKNANLRIATENLQNITVNGGYYSAKPVSLDYIAECKNMMQRTEWWDFPVDRVKLPATSKVLFTESFSSGYNFQTATKLVTDGSTAYAQSGRLALELGTGVTAGISFTVKDMVPDTPNSLYRFETRVNAACLPQGAALSLNISATSGDILAPFSISADGLFAADQYGDSVKIADITVDPMQRTFYRLQVWFDMRTVGCKTYQVVLLKDDGTKLAESAWYHLPDDMQEAEETFATFDMTAIDFSAESDTENSGKVALDYIFLSCNGGTLGDVNGDTKVDSTDARMTLQYFVGSIEEDQLNLTAADVSGDGNVDSTDARLILQKFVGSITEFPAA